MCTQIVKSYLNCLHYRQILIFQIRNKHMAGGVGDHAGKRRGSCRQLGSYAAGPEHGDCSGLNGHYIAEIRCSQIADADLFRISQVNRGVVG